jgi:hypothetical protein
VLPLNASEDMVVDHFLLSDIVTHTNHFLFVKRFSYPSFKLNITKKTHDKNTKKPLTISLGIFPFNGNLAF